MIDEYPCTIKTKIYGSSYGNRQNVISDIEPGDELFFFREKYNPHDHNAIVIYFNGEEAGYLNADLSYEIAPLVDSGEYVLFGRALEVTGGCCGKLFGCNIEITIAPIDAKTLYARKVKSIENDFNRDKSAAIKLYVLTIICFVLTFALYFVNTIVFIVMMSLSFVLLIVGVSLTITAAQSRKMLARHKKHLSQM